MMSFLENELLEVQKLDPNNTEYNYNNIAYEAIKYLVADGRYKYIETGSFLSIKKNTKDILIPI